MKISKIGLLALGISLSFCGVSATAITNLTATPNGSTLEITWTPLDASDMANVEGYAVQWNTVLNNVRIDKVPTKTVSGSTTSLSLRAAGFERETPYYFRVYTYVYEGRGKYTLTNPSTILKWTWKENGEVETTTVAANDPGIVDNSTDTTDPNADVFTFGILRGGRPFDTSVRMQWSRPSISKNRYDGFQIIVSKNSSLSSPVGKLEADDSEFKGYIQGLEPDTTYYAAGEFVDNGSAFGRGPVMTFKTAEKFSVSQKTQFERTFARMKKLGLGATVDFGGGDDASTDDTEGTDSTTTTTTTSSDDSLASLDAAIAALKLKIAGLQSDLRDLQNQRSAKARTTHASRRARTSNVNTRTTTSTRSTITSGYRTSTTNHTRFQRKTQPVPRYLQGGHESAPSNEPVLMY